jgi:hypothetical protein
MLDAALFSRDADPVQFALWVGALVTAIPFVVAIQQTFTYATLRAAPPDVVALVLFTHRLFFVVYGMLAAALVAALSWEALFPAAEDLDVIGVLPVRPRTIAAAYLGAAVTSGTIFCAATALPAAFIFSLVAGTVSGILSVPRAFAGHAIATSAASLFVLLVLLGVRGACAVVVGTRFSARLGTLLQLVTIVSLAGVLFFLPGVVGTLAPAMLDDGNAPAIAVPALWFVGLFSAIAGTSRAFLSTEGLTGLVALFTTALVVIAIYLAPAALVRRRAMELRERARANRLTMAARVVAGTVLRSPVSRAIFVFATASISRSRRHLLLLASYVGFGIAVLLITILATIVRHDMSLDRPAISLVSLPLALMFFLVIGLRSACAVPTDIAANWLFRLADPGARRATSATRACLLLYGVAPPMLLALLAELARGWSLHVIVPLCAVQAAAGVFLVECVLYRWTKVPFASAHAADPETVRSGWVVAIGSRGMCWRTRVPQVRCTSRDGGPSPRWTCSSMSSPPSAWRSTSRTRCGERAERNFGIMSGSLAHRDPHRRSGRARGGRNRSRGFLSPRGWARRIPNRDGVRPWRACARSRRRRAHLQRKRPAGH